jgi:hypothetical protein
LLLSLPLSADYLLMHRLTPTLSTPTNRYSQGFRQMQIGPKLQFNCPSCSQPVLFNILDAKNTTQLITCTGCKKGYTFAENILRQIRKFVTLCEKIQESEEILGKTSVAIDVGPNHVKVPFRLLLTRLGSVLDLDIGGQKLEILFRTEPLKDMDELLSQK